MEKFSKYLFFLEPQQGACTMSETQFEQPKYFATRAELAALFQVSERTINLWRAEGLPRTAMRNRYKRAACIRWYMRNKYDGDRHCVRL